MKTDKLKTITKLFNGSEIRSIWNDEKEDYYFSVIDVVMVLTESNNPRKYRTTEIEAFGRKVLQSRCIGHRSNI